MLLFGVTVLGGYVDSDFASKAPEQAFCFWLAVVLCAGEGGFGIVYVGRRKALLCPPRRPST